MQAVNFVGLITLLIFHCDSFPTMPHILVSSCFTSICLLLLIPSLFFRDLRDSVANLLRDVNYKEPRMQNKSTFDKHHPAISSNDPDLQISPMEKSGHNDNYYTKSRRFKPPVTDTPLHTELSDKMHPIFGENGEINTKNTLHFDYDAGKNRLGSFSSLSDQNSEISSISSVPDLVTGSDHTSVGQSLFVGDQFSTLTCDSGEFRSDLANLSMKIRNMQESLQNAKRT